MNFFKHYIYGYIEYIVLSSFIYNDQIKEKKFPAAANIRNCNHQMLPQPLHNQA